jgi:hypothetical protein
MVQTLFDNYTASTETVLVTKIEDGINVGGANEIFSGKSGTTLVFRTISGGTNTTVTQVGDIQKIDVTIPVEQNTYVTGFTYNPTSNLHTIYLNNGSAYTTNINVVSGLTVENYIDFKSNGVPTAISGRTYYDTTENALSYFPNTPNMDVTINLGQEGVIQVYNNTGSLIPNGAACEVHGDGATNGVPTIRLAIASATTVLNDTRYQVSGIATHDIANGETGFITKFGIVRDLTITGITEGTDIWLSDTNAGEFVYDITSYPATSRISKIGHIITTGVTTAKILVDISNEPTSITSILEDTLLTQNNASTGIVNGGIISTASTTTFNITGGKGHIADNSNPLVPIFTIVDWDAFTGVTSTYIGDTGETHTYLTVTTAGILVQTPGSVGLTAQQKRQEILIGGILHIGGQILFTWERQIPLINPINQLEDLTTSIGAFSISGNRISKITGTLSLEKSIGEAFYLGGNYTVNTENPNILTNGVLSASTLVYANGTTIIGPSGTTIDVDNYDPDGLGVITPLANNKYAAHRIWHQPTENVLIFQYGQNQFNSLTEAKSNFSLLKFEAPKVLFEEAYLVAVIISEKNNLDLDNAATSIIIPQGKFAGTGGGGTTPDTLQTAYSNSITPEITTDITRGAVDFKHGGTGVDKDLITFQNSGNTINGYIDYNGNATFSGQVDTNTARLISTPTQDNAATDILVRNQTTGVIEYRTVNSLSGDTDTNFYVTGGTVTSGGTLDLELKGTSDVSIDLTETKRLHILAFEGAAISAAPTYLTSTGTLVHAYGGANNNDDEGAYNFAVPSDYISGGSLYIKFMTVTTTSSNVQFEMNVTSIDLGGDFSTATDIGLLQITQGSTAYNLIETNEFTGGTATYSVGKNVSVKVNRDASDAGDTYNNQDALLWGIVFEYTGIK